MPNSLMSGWSCKKEMMGDDPPYLAVGTEVSAKYKGAFCEAKIRKVVRSVKCKVIYKQGLGGTTVTDDQIKGTLRAGSIVEVRHPDKKEFVEATITKIQDCSQYTVVFDDGDITTLRRSALCLKSGRHFAESETLDQLPLTHPEHFSNPVIGGRRGRRNRNGAEDSSDDDEPRQGRGAQDEKEADIGRVVCVEGGDKKKQKDNWFPGLVVAPTAQDTVRIHVKDEYLVRSFKDGRYYTVPKKEATEFTREIGLKVDNHTLRGAVEKALMFLDRDELPPHWDRDLLFGLVDSTATDSEPGSESDGSDNQPREEKDHFVAQLYKFMDDRGTPINKGPTISTRDVDLYRLFKVVQNLGGYNRVTNNNHWKTVSHKIGFGQIPITVNLVKHAYKKFLHSFEEFYRKLGCTMVNHPRTNRNRNKTGRSLIRDRDRATPVSGMKSDHSKEKNSEKEEENTILPIIMADDSDQKIKYEVEESCSSKEIVKDTERQFPRLKVTDTKEKVIGKKIESPIFKTKEDKEDDEKSHPHESVKEIKKKPKPRKMLSKVLQNDTKKSEICKDTQFKEKKKRLFPRVAGKKDTKIQRVNQQSGLASTRQKRTIKDRVKAFADKFKMKITKEPSIAVQDAMEKVIPGVKLKTNEEQSIMTGNKTKKDDNVLEEKKKVGRKRKERQETSEDGLDVLPTYKKICIGDKLKVYYGPTHESKVTYEAKVLNVRGEGEDVTYFVHYTGWNTRYDEWIKNSLIADNLSWTQGRLPKKTSLSPKCGKRKNSGGKNDGGGRSTPSSISSYSKNKPRLTSKPKLSVSESEVEYDSENADMESESNIKQEEKLPDYLKEEEELGVECHSSLTVEQSQEKRKYKRKVGDEDSTKGIKRKLEEKIKPDINTEEFVEVFGIKTKKDKKKSDKKVDLEGEKDAEKIQVEMSEKIKTENESKESRGSLEQVKNETGKNFETISETDLKDPSPDKCSIYAEAIIKNVPDKNSDDNQVTIPGIFFYPEDEIDEKMLNRIDKESIKNKKKHDDSQSIGRDFDLNQIRSELKGIDKTIKVSVNVPKVVKEEEEEEEEEEEMEDDEEEEEEEEEDDDDDDEEEEEEERVEEEDIEIKKDTNEENEHYETVDVYEFKEPEPFHFEGRKTSEDKSKLQRRPLSRMLDELKMSPTKKKIKQGINLDSKKKVINEDSTGLGNATPHALEPCEATFDKICAPPLRAATEESSNEMKLFCDLPAEDDDDDVDEDSEDRLVISEHESDSEALFTHQYRNHEEIFPTDIRSTSSVIEENSRFAEFNTKSSGKLSDKKEEFNNGDEQEEGNEEEEDDDEDDEEEEDEEERVDDAEPDEDEDDMENEVINVAIQRAMNQNISEDSNEDDLLQRVSPTTNGVQIDKEIQIEELASDVKINLNSIVMDPSVEEFKEERIEGEIDLSSENAKPLECVKEENLEFNEKKNEEEKLDTKGIQELYTNKAMESGAIEVITHISETELIDNSVDISSNKERNSPVENSVSLFCEETIPGSPAPLCETNQLLEEGDTHNEIKGIVDVQQEASQQVQVVPQQVSPSKEAATVMDNTPPTTPDSPMSSSSVSPRGERSESSPPLDNESTKSHRDSEVEMETFNEVKDLSDDESRMDETVNKIETVRISPTKKGRRPRKRSEEATKRKFSRLSRHHGSDSDTSENSVSNTRVDIPSRPQRPCKYNFSVILDPELDASQRISILQQKLQDLRKAYASVKAELASIDRRRKKLRKRERENALNRMH